MVFVVQLAVAFQRAPIGVGLGVYCSLAQVAVLMKMPVDSFLCVDAVLQGVNALTSYMILSWSWLARMFFSTWSNGKPMFLMAN